MTEKRSIWDVIPEKVLVKIEGMEEQIRLLERQAAFAQADAQELRMQIDRILDEYREKVARMGWEACRAEAEAEDMRAWACDPLPGQKGVC